MRPPLGLRFVPLALLTGSVGCGGGAAMLHPAHTLPESRVSFGAGVSGHFALGDADSAIERGRAVSATNTSAGSSSEQQFVEGAIANALLSPGVSPWVGARVGLGGDYEAGLTYLGRTVRADARHSWEKQHIALSAGGGVSAVLLRPGSSGTLSSDSGATAGTGRFEGGVDDVTATGWGIDIPVLVGYRSGGDVLQAWAGARGGFEMIRANLPIRPDTTVPLGDPGSETSAPADARRFWVGGLVGLSVGLSPVWVSIELQAAYQALSGRVELPEGSAEPTELSMSAGGLTLTPAGAVSAHF
jgi:hypothetical protein